MRHFDTIVAPISGTQPAAVAWLRLSGPDAWLIASKVFKNWPDAPQSHRATFGTYHHGDEGLALPFAADRSYTGEQAVELSLHGSRVSVRNLVEQCIMAGARMAEPGEFTLRAFLNGRMDLTQAEAVRETVEAQTDAQFQFAKIGRSGTLRREFTDLRDKVLSILARVEASVDFSEEIGDLDKPRALAEVREIVQVLDGWIATSNWGEIVRTGYRVAILGRPNAGKSSLMNALLGRNRSIVTEVPGTTRDYLEETVELAGWPVVLIDTAGMRATEDPVESIGVELTRELATKAHHVLYLYDASVGWSEEDKANTEALDVSLTIVANKVDLAKPEFGTPVSTVTKEGIEDLLDQLAAAADFMPIVPLLNLRHLPFVEKARVSLDECLTALAEDSPDDLLSVLLSESAMSLGAITGETATPDMIDRIFHDFCIGK